MRKTIKFLSVAFVSCYLSGCCTKNETYEAQPEAPSAQKQVVAFNNFQQGECPMMIPAVRSYKTQQEKLTLAQNFTVSLPQEEKLIVEQFTEDLKRWPDIQVSQVKEGAFCSFVLTDMEVPEHPQGYCIEIDEAGIRVFARERTGLFYGAQTLRNMFHNIASPELNYARIEDWPDMNRRGYFFTIRRTKPEDLPKIKKMFDVLASLKMNWLLLEVAEAFPFENNQLTKRSNAFTREQMEDLRDFCRARHLEITPTFQVLSHNLWMTFHPDWEKMREAVPNKPWNSQSCLSNLQARELTKECILQQIELFKPEIFFLMMDEIEDKQIQSCPVCSKKDRAQLLIDYVKYMENTVKAAGARPMVCQDSFIKCDSTLPYADQIRENLDKNDMILWWSYRNILEEKRIAPFKGFQLVGHALHAKPHNLVEMCKLIKKYGGNDCTVVYWYYSSNGTLVNLAQETPDSLGGMVTSCDIMWHFTEDYASRPYDAVYEMMRRLHPDKIVADKNGQMASPIPLNSSINAELNETGEFPHLDDAQLEQLKEKLAHTPEQFQLVTTPGKYYGLRVSGNEKTSVRTTIRHALGRKASRLSFLMTSSRPLNGSEYLSAGVYGSLRYKADVAARLRLLYDDGSFEELPLRFRYEFNEWNRPYGGFNTRNVVRGMDLENHYYTFGVFDFDNPKPEKIIKSFQITSNFLNGISPVILAVSAWDMDRPCEQPLVPFEESQIKAPYGLGILQGLRRRIVEDFETGVGSCYITKDGNFSEPIKMSIVDDPTAPSVGKKVLKISVPPATLNKNNWSGGLIRFNIDMPYTLPEDTKMVALTIRISDPNSGFNRCQDYLVAKDMTTHRYYKQSVSTDWTVNYRNIMAKSQSSPLLKNPIKDTALRRISFFFNTLDKPVDIYVDDIGDSPDLIPCTPMWSKMDPAD